MPIPISDRYSRYKAGTTKITRWLKTAANSCGDLGKSLAVLCTADDAEATARDLIHLTTVIATSTKSRVQIPLEILVVVKDGHWRAYAGTDRHVDGETEKANQRHRKFIKVPKQVISILRPKYKARLPKSYKKKHGKLELEKAAILDNIYEYLDLEDPKAPTITPTDRVGDSVASGPPTHTSDEKSLLEHLEEAEKIFALWCFFKDYYDLCGFLGNAWQEYKDGTLSFETVCRVTDTAFMLMEKASTLLAVQYPDLRLWMASKSSWASPRCHYAATSPSSHSGKGRASCIMHEFRLALCSPNEYSHYPVEARNISHTFSVALQAIAPEIRLLTTLDESQGEIDKHTAHVREDFLLDSLVRLCKNGILTPWLANACQAYMRIYDVLDTHVTKVRESYAARLLGLPIRWQITWSTWCRCGTGLDIFRAHLLGQVEEDVV
ncbi:hypothetical protein LTR56_025777 [Elasticomyces elasticus]|nr:hypothetical protein LTR56_025777 [Elasticomyces elasticus]KAK4904577.1 hypothetical protein LTR49_025995 [Elasticomyces elasticus]